MTDYRDFADHPRYGKFPRVTGLNPLPKHGGVYLLWHAPENCRIPNTAIEADLSRQTPATVAVTHYFDEVRECRDCRQSFIFFAEEQKHWYEGLGFPLDADCIRCAACRKHQQAVEQANQRYQQLRRIETPNHDQLLEIAETTVELVACEFFSTKSLDKVRAIINQLQRELPEDSTPNYPSESAERLAALRLKVAELVLR